MPRCHPHGPRPAFCVPPRRPVVCHPVRPSRVPNIVFVPQPPRKPFFNFWHRPRPAPVVITTNPSPIVAPIGPGRRVSPIASIGAAAIVAGVIAMIVGACLAPVTVGASAALIVTGAVVTVGGIIMVAVA